MSVVTKKATPAADPAKSRNSNKKDKSVKGP
jgi:hypothetical protein